ncbi:MAG: imidazolonepropionase [Anaerolineaceae bacterium]|nr:imidazolonepropionase [Anaerolineaceae bacterium]MBN2677392.1 imidazolonepropionase [Anaerolineaceae bacterium]
MLIHSAAQLLTIAGSPQRGLHLGELGIIENGAVLINGETIVKVGESQELLSQYPHESLFDASGLVVMPGLVDPHTHLPWVGDRSDEFEMRLIGKSYMEIMSAGGGINSTVGATINSSFDQLLDETRQRARTLFNHGTTTAEAKTGYGLTLENEIRLLQSIDTINQEGPLELIPTFLGAHIIPPDYQAHPDDYVQSICLDMLPRVVDWWRTKNKNAALPFVDVFCDQGAFSIQQTQTIFKAACGLGFPIKIHADEFANLGGAQLAVAFHATSADHLVKTSPEDIQALAKSTTVAVSLPCTPFGLGHSEYTPARDLLASDALFALASDLNPGTAWCGNMQFVIALACRYMHLTPAQAVASSTINAAAAINLADRIGSIEPGKQADLIILSVNDYRQLAYRFGINLVKNVIKKGRVYSV